MKKLLVAVLLLCCLSPPVFATSYPIQQSVNTISGSTGTLDGLVIPSSFVAGFTWVSVQLTGTWTGTVTWEVSNDGTNWSPVALILPSSVGGGMVSTATMNGTYHGPKGSFLYFRGRLSTVGSGTVVGLASFSPTPSAIQAKGDTTGQCTGTLTSVDVSGGTTGLTFTGGPITSSGTITATGTAMAIGGTVVDGDAGAVLFNDSLGKLGQDAANLSFDSVAKTLTIGAGNIPNSHHPVTIANGDNGQGFSALVFDNSQDGGVTLRAAQSVSLSSPQSVSIFSDSRTDVSPSLVYIQGGDTEGVGHSGGDLSLLSGAGDGGSGAEVNLKGATDTVPGRIELTGKTVLSASSSTAAGLNLPPGSAPSSPTDGDLWTTTAGAFIRINGGTVGPLAAGGVSIGDAIGGGTAGSLLFIDGTGNLGQNHADLSFTPATEALAFGGNTLNAYFNQTAAIASANGITISTAAMTGDSGHLISIQAGAGSGSGQTGGNVNLAGGAADGGNGGSVVVHGADDTNPGDVELQAKGIFLLGNAILYKKVDTYNSISTVGNGVPAEYATVDLTAQTAAIAATTMYAVPVSGAGMYRISYVAKVTTAASVSAVLGGTNGFQVKYTDADDAVVITTGASITSNLDTTQSQISGVIIVNAAASSNLQYIMGYTSVGTAMAYALHIKVEAL